MLIDIYRDGRFADFIGFPSPFYTSSRELIPYEKFMKLRFEGLLWTRTQMPHHAFPPSIAEPAQLFPFGYTDNGETFFWLRKGHFNEWPIIYMDPGYTQRLRVFLRPGVGFLRELALPCAHPQVFPAEFFSIAKPGICAKHRLKTRSKATKVSVRFALHLQQAGPRRC